MPSLRFILLLIVLMAGSSFLMSFLGESPSEVSEELSPYMEGFLSLLVNKNHDKLYSEYYEPKGLEKEVFDTKYTEQLKNLEKYFGVFESFQFSRSYIGGVGYFFVYKLKTAKGDSYSCTFEFSIVDSKELTLEEFSRISIRKDFREEAYFFMNPKPGITIALRGEDGKVTVMSTEAAAKS